MINKFVGIALISALLSFLLDGLGFRSKRLFATLCMIVMMIGLVSGLSEIFGPIMDIANDVGVGEVAELSLRAVGLGYVFGFTADICTSVGEGGIANLVTLIGRVEIFGLAMPYFLKTIKIGMELLS